MYVSILPSIGSCDRNYIVQNTGITVHFLIKQIKIIHELPTGTLCVYKMFHAGIHKEFNMTLHVSHVYTYIHKEIVYT